MEGFGYTARPCHHVFPGRRRIAEVAGGAQPHPVEEHHEETALWLGLSLVLSYGVPPPAQSTPAPGRMTIRTRTRTRRDRVQAMAERYPLRPWTS